MIKTVNKVLIIRPNTDFIIDCNTFWLFRSAVIRYVLDTQKGYKGRDASLCCGTNVFPFCVSSNYVMMADLDSRNMLQSIIKAAFSRIINTFLVRNTELGDVTQD